MTICGLSLHQGNTESRKTLEQKLIFQLGTLSPHGINERFSLIYSQIHVTISLPMAYSSSTLSYKPQQPTIPLFALTKG